MKFKKPFEQQKPHVTIITGDSLTRQADAPKCDINYIVSQYDKTGSLLPFVRNAVAQYGDFTEVNEFKEAQDFVARAQTSFEKLPATVREKFHNNAGEFFEFATNPSNYDSMVEMGLAEPIPEPIPEPILEVPEMAQTAPENAPEG